MGSVSMGCASTALIVGGGIAGLATAIALTRVGVRCEVVEKGNPKEGASLGISGRAADAIAELGIYDLVHKAGKPFPPDSTAASVRDSAGNLLSPGPSRPQWPGAKQPVGIFRPTLIDLMTKVAKELGVEIKYNTTFSLVENRNDGVRVVFDTGEQHSYDFMVGADGIDSATRKELFPDQKGPTFSGQVSIRWLASGPPVEPESWYKSSVGRLGFYYLPEGFDYVPSVYNVPEYKRYSDEELHEMLTELLDSMSAPAIIELRSRLNSDAKLIGRPFRWILVSDPWYRNRGILVGDAAHATTSHMGMGGGMALEDSVVLAQCIRDEATIEKAFKAFMVRRFDRVSTVVHTSLELGKLEQSNAPPLSNAALMSNALKTISQPY